LPWAEHIEGMGNNEIQRRILDPYSKEAGDGVGMWEMCWKIPKWYMVARDRYTWKRVRGEEGAHCWL